MSAILTRKNPGGAGLIAENQNTDASIVATNLMARKEISTLIAQFALEDHQVHKGGNDDFIVARWGMSRYCENLAALRRFALVLGIANVPN